MTTIRFVGDLPLWAGGLAAVVVALGGCRYYRRESRSLPGRLGWLLPLLRSGALFLAVMILTGPVLHHRRVIGQLGRVLIFLDASRSMGVSDKQMPPARKLLVARQQGWLLDDQAETSVASAVAMFDRSSRWRRAENCLLDPSSGFLSRLAKTHDVELFALCGSETQRLWDGRATAGLPTQLGIEPLGQVTDLGPSMAGNPTENRNTANHPGPADEVARQTAVVLLSDGRHNFGSSPLQAARVLGGRGIPVFPVGFGSRREPPDLALVEVEHPQMVFQKDRVRGTLIVKDRMPPGESFVVQIGHQGEILWQQRLTTEDAALRRIEFEFSIDALVERLGGQFDAAVRHDAVPLSLDASIVPLAGETELSNNDLAIRLMAITRRYKLLLIDGRSRWETRYLRNLFQRDQQWHVDTVLAGPAADQPTLPRGDGDDRFPTEEAALFDYDLIVFGEVPPGVLTAGEQLWIRNFVERRGGGIVFIDGQRGYLRTLDDKALGPLLPVYWLGDDPASLPARLQLTDEGANQTALRLESDRTANRKLWQQLPAPHQLVKVQAVPGSEVFVEAVVGQDTYPAMVARSFGAGRVFYCAFDETWRWRYKVADFYHQRFWNQVAKWIMPRPFAVSDRYASLDSGPAGYAGGESAEIRLRLRGVDGRPVSDATVDALLWQDGRIVATVSLAAEEAQHGIYRGRTGPLSEGQYEVGVRAAGFSNEALKARTSFVVVAPKSGEMQEVACNDELLRQLALASGGRFLPEEHFGQLAELLRPLSSGHVVESDTLLWQSYWWFTLIVGLLAMEWTLRKRAGLL